MIARPLALAVLAPLLVAWNGGGSGAGTWIGIDGPQAVSLSAVARVEDPVRVVFSLPAGGGGDALVFVTTSPSRIGRSTRLPAPGVEVGFREYGPDGRLRAGAAQASSGEVTFAREGGRWVISVSATWRALGSGHGERALHDARIHFDELELPGEVTTGGGVAVQGGGCDGDDWTDDDDWEDDGRSDDGWSDGGWSDDGWSDDGWGAGDESTGCEGDDVDSEWGDDSGGGCEGEDSGGGCEGDDVGGGGDAPSCEGDAIAAGASPRRSPAVVRLLNQLPWLMVLFGLRLARRRPRRR